MIDLIIKLLFWLSALYISVWCLDLSPRGLLILPIAAVLVGIDYCVDFSRERFSHKIKIITTVALSLVLAAALVVTHLMVDIYIPDDKNNGKDNEMVITTSKLEDTTDISADSTAEGTEKLPEDSTFAQTTEEESSIKAPEKTDVVETTCAPDTTEINGGGVVDIHVHEYSDATCTNPQICSCGETQGSALGHSFGEDGVCTRCSAVESEVDDYVWISTKGGKKYHSHAYCSNMSDPELVTEEEAIDLGFEKCKRCY